MAEPLIAVVIPCYRVRAQILDVLGRIGPECGRIYVVDDACPEASGKAVQEHCRDPRVRVLFHETNQGVGGAVMTGYAQALRDGAAVLVKMDGDGQMDPALLPRFLGPILRGQADYTKGNRFFDIEGVRSMPLVRLLGNTVLSFLAKLSSGYWNVFDPTNGYTAIHAAVARLLPLDKLSRRYFFESDLLFRLGTLRACVVDVPMTAVYGAETSSLRVRAVAFDFFWRHAVNTVKRIFYNYFLRGFSAASVELVLGTALAAFGAAFGAWAWIVNEARGTAASTGTVMLAALPVILGMQFLVSFLANDIAAVPHQAIHPLLQEGPPPWRSGPNSL
jgi:glycosyltransferase involved in cell wall biosynthesis